MPRSFLVKKYLKQKYDEDQIKLQQQQEQQQKEREQQELQQLKQQALQDSSNKARISLDSDNRLVSSAGSNENIIVINNNNNVKIESYRDRSHHHAVTSLVSSPLTTHANGLDVHVMSNGYFHDITHIQNGQLAEANEPRAMVPHSDNEVAARENFQPRRSVIVTNSNHPANRYLSNGDFHGYDVIHSPGLPTEKEQNAPYDYSLRREERPPITHAPPSPKRYAPATSPAPAHSASPVSGHAPLPSPPPAHQGIESHHTAPNSPRRTPPHKFLPADHPFNHPLIQQLINQRLHVPGENSDGSNSNFNDSLMAEESSYQHHRQYYHYSSQDVDREDEVKDSNSLPHSAYSLASPPHNSSESSTTEYQFYTNNSQTSSFPTTLTSSHLPPLQSYPHPHSFPPSPSPTIPSSSPTLPNSESKSYFILPPPSSPSSNDSQVPSTCHTPDIPPNPQSPDAAESTNKTPNSYTYEAFLISDGRSRKRSYEEAGDEKMSGRLRYTCNECGKDYATSSNLSRHKQTHRALDSKSAKKCPHCDKVYVSMPALSMHILTHDLKHACDICGKTFSRPWLLQGHMRSHTGEKPFGCAHCGKAFADRSNLRAHMQTHSAFKHFACTKCNKTFALKSYLNKHLESSCVKVE